MGRPGLTPSSSSTYFNLETLFNDLTRIELASSTKRGLAVCILDSDGNQLSLGQADTPSAIAAGNKTVTTAGTPEQLGSSTACRYLDITALSSNTGIIAIGGSSVDANSTPVVGAYLNAEDSIRIQIDDLNKVYIDAAVNGEGVSFTYTS